MKRVLFITYYYPPTGGAGVQRVLKFTKYLPRFNWQPLIIAPKWVAEEARDESFLAEIPQEVKVWRTFIIEPRAWPFLKRIWKKELAKEIKSGGKKASILKRIFNFLRNLIFIPDDSCFWLPFLIWRGVWVARKEKVDLIFASGPPYTVFIAGKILKRLLKIPLVVDFRDSWTALPEAHLYRKIPLWRKKIDFKLEKEVLEESDKIIVASEGYVEYFVKIHKINPEKIETITNGFDENDFKGLKKISSSKFTITYMGSFYGGYNPFNFLEGFKNFIKKNPRAKKDIEIKFIGHFTEGIKEKVDDILKNTGFKVNYLGYLPHKLCLQHLLGSSLLFLIVAKGEGDKNVYSGKIFEYIASGTPIFALVPKEGAAARLIKRTNTGIVVDPEDISEIEKSIEFLYQKWLKGEKIVEPNWEEIKKYERKKLTQKLAKIFDEVMETRKK